MTNREKAIVMAFTGACMLSGDNLKHYYDYCSELLGHPAYTHEIYTEQIQELAKPDFLKLCAETTDEGAAKHGHWELCGTIGKIYVGVCSSCKLKFAVGGYCGICGATMDEVSE